MVAASDSESGKAKGAGVNTTSASFRLERRRCGHDNCFATLFTLSPLGSPFAHRGLHVAAVVHSSDTITFLPPDAANPSVDREIRRSPKRDSGGTPMPDSLERAKVTADQHIRAVDPIGRTP